MVQNIAFRWDDQLHPQQPQHLHHPRLHGGKGPWIFSIKGKWLLISGSWVLHCAQPNPWSNLDRSKRPRCLLWRKEDKGDLFAKWTFWWQSEQVSGCEALEKCLLIQEMGATNPEKVKMVVKNMETFMPKVLISLCPDVYDCDHKLERSDVEEFLPWWWFMLSDRLESTLHCDDYGTDDDCKENHRDNLPPQVRSIRAFGSAGINLAYLAMGAVDCYFEFGFHIWDYAGPCLLVRCLWAEWRC